MAVEGGLIQPYKVATWDEIPDSAKDPDGYWYGDYYGVLAFEVNTSEVANPPAEYADLLKPEYNGQIALSGDPLTSNAAMLSVWAAGLSTGATGEEAAQAGLDFFKQLNDMGNFVPIDGDSRTVGIGETPILIDWSYNSIANDVNLAGNPDIELSCRRRAGLRAFTCRRSAPMRRIPMPPSCGWSTSTRTRASSATPRVFATRSGSRRCRRRAPSRPKCWTSCPARRVPSSHPSMRSVQPER